MKFPKSARLFTSVKMKGPSTVTFSGGFLEVRNEAMQLSRSWKVSHRCAGNGYFNRNTSWRLTCIFCKFQTSMVVSISYNNIHIGFFYSVALFFQKFIKLLRNHIIMLKCNTL